MNPNRNNRRGLVLLIVLGMLGLFSLLAVTYMVYSGQSRTSGILINRAKLQNPGKLVYDIDIISLVLRGASNNQSPFTRHSLLGDVYGRYPITGRVRGTGNNNNTNTAAPLGAVLVGKNNAASGSLQSNATFCKIPLDHYFDLQIEDPNSAGELSPIDDAYNARIFTMLEGPLEGYSFRILKYIGNEDGTPNTGGTPPILLLNNLDPLCYSILIDFSEMPQDAKLTGAYSNGNAVSNYEGTIGAWVSDSHIGALFYSTTGAGYKFLVNDAVYNGIGYGYNPGAENPATADPNDLDPIGGNLTQYWKGDYGSRYTNLYVDRLNPGDQLITAPIRPVGSTPPPKYMPVGLLPNYDYISSGNLLGSTNEGYDVADYRDYWLANINPDGDYTVDATKIIPSYHRPELVNYIYNRYLADTGSEYVKFDNVVQLIRLLDYACARPLPVAFTTDGINIFPYEVGRATNINFKEGNIQPLIVVSGNNGDVTNFADVERFVFSLINAGGIGWDVDSDGDGIPDAIWVDPGLPPITGPDGKILKVLSAVHIQDLDSKINVNLAGDTSQAFPTYSGPVNNAEGFVRNSLTANLLTQGNGVGPTELGLFHLMSPAATVADRLNYLRAIMKARNGDDGSQSTTRNFLWTGVPGKEVEQPLASLTTYTGNDKYSIPFERGSGNTFLWAGHSQTPRRGYSMQVRGRAGIGLDLFGNVALLNRPDMLNSLGNRIDYLSETADDGYELNQNGAPSDRVFTLQELERVLRRFDGDISSLSDRLSSILKRDTAWTLNAEVNRVLTTRSHELRNMPIGTAGRDFENSGAPRLQNMGNVFEWLAALHEQNYRTVPAANQNLAESASNDPSMVKGFPGGPTQYPLSARYATFAPSVVRALFPTEFRHGLRMNLNRPFGNGYDNNLPGQTGFQFYPNPDNDPNINNYVVDDPRELAQAVEVERTLGFATLGYVDSIGFYDSVRYNFPTPDVNGNVRANYYPVDGQRRYRDPDPMNGPFQRDATRPVNGLVNPISSTSRQIYARQLYCLAQLLVPQDYQFSTMNDLTYTPGSSNYQWYKRRARTLAQWAINVVDFRDPDAIMTRFEYDYLPFGSRDGGTTAHASLSAFTDGGGRTFSKDPGWEPEAGDVVWGMEYPELLLTETLAFHDKRVRKTNKNSQDQSQRLPVQFRIPQGSLFVELVNTRSVSSSATSQDQPAVPKELYVDVANNVNGPEQAVVALDLDMLAPQPPVGSTPAQRDFGVQPVWRIGVVDGKNAGNTALPNFQNFDAAINATTAGANIRVPGTVQNPAVLTQTNQTSPTGTGATNGLYNDLTDPSQAYFDRVIWFTHYSPTQIDASNSNPPATKTIPNLRQGTADLNHRVFYNRRYAPTPVMAATPQPVGSEGHPLGTYLPLGQYLTLVPRIDTRVGSLFEQNGEDTDQPIYRPSAQRILVDDNDGGTPAENPSPSVANQILQYRLNGIATPTLSNPTVQVGTNIYNPIVQVSQADPPSTAWNDGTLNSPLVNGGVGLNISEPLPTPTGYYPMPSSRVSTDNTSGYTNIPPDSYADLSAGGRLSTDLFDDDLDMRTNPVLAGQPIAGTLPNFRSLYLQRLANPLMAYDPEWNPYITVDVMTVDLTLFTGENQYQDYLNDNNNPRVAFQSRYKDGRGMDGRRQITDIAMGSSAPSITPPASARDRVKSYFSASTASLLQSTQYQTTPTRTYFEFELGNANPATYPTSSTTLGYLNMGASPDGTSFDGFGMPISISVMTGTIYGQPNPANIIMASLYWANRDFANPAELLQVPFTSAGKLSTYFTSALGGIDADQSGSLLNATEDVYGDTEQRLGPFGHLFGFFDSNKLPTNATAIVANTPAAGSPPRREQYWMGNTNPGKHSNLSLLTELVETPPRYPDTATPMNPVAMTPDATIAGESSLNAAVDQIRDRMLFDFRAPNNLRKSYTNPGKININNIDSEAVWNSIEWNTRTTLAHRNIATTPPTPTLQSWTKVNNSRRGYPTTSNSLNNNINDLVPTQFAGTWRNPFNVNITPINEPRLRASESTSATWRRSRANIANVRGTEATSLFSDTALVGEQHAAPIEQVANSFINMQRTGRLSNLVTNQSNVFAIWITVGLFEWDPVNGVGKEYVGTDGNTTRQRSFYMVDRTVPVAFREGNKFNTEKAILLRRNISR